MYSEIDRAVTHHSITSIDRYELVSSIHRWRENHLITQHCIILSFLIEESPINSTARIHESIARCSIFTDIPVIHFTLADVDDIMSSITTNSYAHNTAKQYNSLHNPKPT